MKFQNMELTVHNAGAFQDGSPCIELYCEDGPYARISFCANDGENVFPASKDCIWLKDWSENEEIARFLLDENYLELTGKRIPQAFVVYKEARITTKLKQIMK